VVKPEDLQATFENLVCIIKDNKDASFSSISVSRMLKSTYEWIVFDENL
jgi:hypothetical protein